MLGSKLSECLWLICVRECMFAYGSLTCPMLFHCVPTPEASEKYKASNMNTMAEMWKREKTILPPVPIDSLNILGIIKTTVMLRTEN